MTLPLYLFVATLQESDLQKNLSLKKQQKQTTNTRVKHNPFLHNFLGQMEHNSPRFMDNFGSFTTSLEVEITEKFI